MSRLVSQRKKLKSFAQMTPDRWTWLGLEQAMPNLGQAPSTDDGYTLKQDIKGVTQFSSELGKLNFKDQKITPAGSGTDITIDGLGKSEIKFKPNTTVTVDGKLSVTGDTTINGKIKVLGTDPKGTAPFVGNTLYVTVDGDDTNDGRAQDSTRACRTIAGAIRSPYYQEGTTIRVAAGHYFEENPLVLLPNTSVIGNDLRTTFVEPLNKDLDLFHVNSGVYIAQMAMLNLRRGSVERYAPGGAGTYTTGAYATAFPPNLTNPIDVYHSPYIQNCTNQSGPWLYDGTMFIPNQTVQIPDAAGTSTWVSGQSTLTVYVSTGTILAGMSINDAANEGYRNAQLLLQANRNFLQNEVVAYVNTTYNGFYYNEDTCKRDTGLIVDAIAQDLLFGGYSQSNFAGLQYWNQGGDTSAIIPGEINTTTQAIQYAGKLASQVIIGTTGTRYQNTVTQITATLFGTSVEAKKVSDDFNVIVNILDRGTVGVTDTIIPNGIIASSATNVINAYNALQLNKEFIRNETLAYIETLRSGFYYNQQNCGRDTGLIVDSIALDLLYPTAGNSQSTFAGLQYWSQSTTTNAILPGEFNTTTNAFRYVSSLTQLIVRNITTGTRYQTTASQVTALPAATTVESEIVKTDFNTFINILTSGTTGVTDIIVPNGIDASVTTGTIHAYNLIQINKDYIQREAIAYIDSISSSTNFTYNKDTCFRDVEYVLDSICFDLLHGGNKQAVQSGVYYYGYNTSTVLANEMPATLDAYQYLANLSQSIIQNVAVTPYQNTVTQVFSAFTATFTESADVYAIVNTITNIIQHGPSVAAGKTPISLTSSTGAYSYQAAKLLESNRSFIQSEIIAYINSKYPPLFDYNKETCYRDLGYMIDSVSIDLLYGGNRQAIQSGVAYYGYTTSTAVPNEIPQVTAAYNYISSILPSIVTGQTITPQQTVVSQVTNLVGGQSAQGTQAQLIVSTITNIVTNGPSVAQDLRPLPLNPSSNSYVKNAAAILEANRAFIQAEVIAYIGNNYFVYNQSLCFRDTGLIIDAVAGDARFGGNKRSIIAGLSYWSGTNSLITGQQVETVGAINYLASIASKIVSNTVLTATYQTFVTQTIDTTKPNGGIVDTRLTTDFGIITTIINGGPTAAPVTVDDIYALIVPSGLSADAINTASQVIAVTEISTGCYAVTLNNPTIAASDNATVYFGSTSVYPFLDDQIPVYWTTSTNADRRLDPNGSGGGALVDGNAPSLRSPIQSFVFDAFTQLNQGGIGVHIINNGYAQLVSVFTIFCSTSVLVENGGIASITNSNANFGDQCLVAKGIGQLSFAGIIWNPAYPTNIPNSEYYPIGYWPNSQQMEVFIPDNLNRPHIGLCMEVVPPDTYLDYGGNRVPYLNSVGYPGYLVASSNTATVNTGSYTIDGIDITDIAVGHTIYVKDIYGNDGPGIGQYYVSTGTRVVDVNYRSITLDRPILNGGGDTTNPNYLNLYFCGNAYYNVLSSVVDTSLGSNITTKTVLIPGEVTTTSEAILYARDIALQIIANQHITGTYQSTVLQTIDTNFQNGTKAASIVADKFNIIAGIVQNGSGSGPDIIRPSQYVSITEEKNSARRLLEENKNFIQAETVAYVDHIWPSQFVYDHVKCNRDTGLIIDALTQDLLFNTSSQSTFAGIQYWNQQGYVGAIASQLTTTTNAVIHLQSLVGEVLTNATTGSRYFTGFAYDSIKCKRDTGLIVDSIVQDLLFTTSSQSVFAGLQYWAQSTSTNSIIPGEQTTTTNAFEYVSSLVQQLVINSTGTRYQIGTTQNVSLPAASTSATVKADFDVFLNILQTGTAGVTDLIVPNGITASTATDAVNAYNIIIANRAYIQAEGIAYTDFISSGTGFTYSTTSCSRDIGFVVDSIAFDILYGGNKQAVQSGVYYYNFTTTNTVIPNESVQTLGAYDHISNLLPWIVTGVTTATYQQDVLQVTNLTPGTIAEATKLQRSITTITNIITNGQTTSTVKSPIGMTITTTATMLNAAAIVHANRDFIAAETIAYVNNYYNAQPFQITGTYKVSTATVNAVKGDFQYIINILQNGIAGVTDQIVPNSITSSTKIDIVQAYNKIQQNREFLQQEVVAYINSTSNFSYNQDNCFRDTGLIVDAIAFDMMYPSIGNSQSTFAGLQYWNQAADTSKIIPGELTTTTSAVIYLSSLAQQVVVNNTGTRYQNTTTQNVSLTKATTLDASTIGTDFGVIINILQNGTAGITDTIVPNGKPTNTTSTNNAYTILQANREFMIEETLAYINYISSSTFVYNRDTCARDLGYMIDSVSFDLVHGGNRQAVQSGVYYYSYINTSSVITYESLQVNDAYARLSDVVSTILLGNIVQKSSGNTATQVTYLLPASNNEVALASRYVSTITSIINKGPTIASPAVPIGLKPSSNASVNNAFNLLLANRSFIQNEVLAYIDDKYTGFTYNQDKCFRDVGYMLDSVSFDTLYGGNRQAIQSGVYYYYYTTSTAIPNEIPQTTAAYNYIKDLVQPIILGQTITAPQQTAVSQVTSLSYTYNSDKCFRDTGLLVDSFAIDLEFPINGYTQSNFAGLQYWNQTTTNIPGEVTTTTSAIKYLSSLAQQVVVNSTGTVIRFVTTASQITTSTTATYTQLYAVKNDFKFITDILTNGPAGATDLIVSNGTTSTSVDANRAYNILQLNKTYMQQQTLSYISSIATNGFNFDTDKCYRDLGYMIDSVSFDILHGGNRQAIQSGVYYYNFSNTSTSIPYQSAQTVAAYERLRDIVPQIVQNQTVAPSPNNTVAQVTTLTAATAFEATQVQSMVDLIVNIINNGPTVAEIATPIGLTATTTATCINAANILEANKTFIQNEIVNYINYVYLIGGQSDITYVNNSIDRITNIIDVGPTVADPGTPIPLTKSNNTSTHNAATLLNANRAFIQAEVISYINNIFNTGFSYDKTKCQRDTGLIVDSIAMDILHGGTTQSAFSGLQYWNQDGYTGQLVDQLTTTTNAFRYLSEVIQDVVQNKTATVTSGNTSTQSLFLPAGITATVALVANDFDVILDILNTGTTGVSDKIVPNSITASTDASKIYAFNLLQANKSYLQEEAVAYVNYATSSNFTYDENKCSRDTGLIVDAVVQDMLFNTSSQITFAGLQYWNQSGYTGYIGNELTTTTNAINYVGSLVQKVIQGITTGIRYQSTVSQVTNVATGTSAEATLAATDFGVITDILTNGTGGVSDIITPNGLTSSTSANVKNAYGIMLANKQYIQTEAVAYVNYITSGTGYVYDSATCYRDVGYMVDSVAVDLLYGGNRQAVQSGVYYYGFSDTDSAIPGEQVKTTIAYDYIKTMLPYIITGQSMPVTYQNVYGQTTYLATATTAEVTLAQSKIDLATDIINYGPDIVTNKTPIGVTTSTNPNVVKAVNMIHANRTFIQAEVIGYINQQSTSTFSYNRDTCYRDVGYMVDSVSVDILYGGNRQAIQSGTYYYGYNSTSSAIPGESTQTLAAYTYLRSIMPEVIEGVAVNSGYQIAQPQVFNPGSIGTVSEGVIAQSSIDIITNIITYGPSAAPDKTPLGTVAFTATSIVNAVTLLQANRDYFAAEMTGFIASEYPGFSYNQTKCQRDTRLIVDAVTQDMLFGGNSQSTFAGLQYWNQNSDTSAIIPGELTTTTAAIGYVKSLAQQILLADTTGPRYSTGTQITTPYVGMITAAFTLADNMAVVVDIIQNGTGQVTDKIVPNGAVTTDTDTINSYNIIETNKDFIKNEVIARITTDNPGWDFDYTKCKRDLGYVIDCVGFDLTHSGNRQSVQAGVYYYGFGYTTAIPNEIPQTTAAYNYLSEIVTNIITGQPVTSVYQFKVKQITDMPVGTDAEVAIVQANINTITNIIVNGPNVAPTAMPISYAESTSTNVINTYNILEANRAFIQAEITSYIDWTYGGQPNYDKNKCYRDMGSIIDSVIFDTVNGGNYKSVNTGEGYFSRKGQYHIVTLEQNITDPTLFIDGATVNFFQQSYISASGYLFEYVGAGTQYGALPQVGKADPVQSKETIQLNNGKVFFTSTDQNGDFRIGPTLVISQATGVLSGRTFQKSLYAEMTPFVLVIGGT